MKTTKLVIGRWPEIFEHIGLDVGTGKHQPCPICGGKDRFRFDDKGGRGTFFCNGCGAGDGFKLLMKYRDYEFKDACGEVEKILNLPKEEWKAPTKRKVQKDPKAILRKLYKESSPLLGECVGSSYLRERGLSVIPNTLRYITSCYESETRKNYPAILATFSAPDSEALTLHRIYVSRMGGKADLKNNKKTLTPVKPLSGGAVRLFPWDENQILGVAEGIETAIAAYELWGVPVWATLSAQLMKNFEPPKNIKRVIVFGDNDINYTGQCAAYALANKIALKGITVDVEIPELQGGDWLDVLNKNI